jgi:hypothetical protein
MFRIALFLLPFAVGALLGAWLVSRGAYGRFWGLCAVSGLAGTLPALRLADGVAGTRLAETLRAALSGAFGCAEIGCGFAGGVAYALAVAGLALAVGLLMGAVMFGHASYRTSGFRNSSARKGGTKTG